MNFSRCNTNKNIIIKLFWLISLLLLIYLCKFNKVNASNTYSNEEVKKVIEQIFQDRNKAIISKDFELIESIYDTSTKYGTWAYEHEKKKIKYIENWGAKQGIKFTDIVPSVVVRRINGDGTNFSANVLCSTEYKYIYEDQPDIINTSRIGTYHYMKLTNREGIWIITKEWYTDPFADSLDLDKLKNSDAIKQHILSQSARDFSTLNERRLKAVIYANQYCGAASEEQYEFKYNKKYRDYNPQGGDCANFASQILFEGGGFRKNSAWNYNAGGATRAWVNADGFKSYMINSGRASVIAYGNYEKVYKASFKLLPGDFVAYEKKGDITHISVVTGADSKGYSLVTCHNTDRNRVPWDLGWSDKKIKFWLVRVHY